MCKAESPQKDDIDKMIKVTANENIAEMSDNVAGEMKKSKSDILGELIPTISSRDFEKLLSYTNMEKLQNYSDECWELLHTPGYFFTTEDLSDNKPAFLVAWAQMVYVKYPTFKIQIFDSSYPKKRIVQKSLENILKDVPNKSRIALAKTEYIFTGDKKEKMPLPYINEITCLESYLQENIDCKNKIVEILKEAGYDTIVIPTYCIRGIKIELLEEGKYFRYLG